MIRCECAKSTGPRGATRAHIAAMSDPRLSVVIPHLNQPRALAACLDSLARGTAQPDEVIVVDNGSETLPRAICDAAGARLLSEPEPGPGPARNAGVAAASGDILAFIDADCLADPGWIAAIRDAFAARPETGILGGDVRIALADPARLTLLEAYESIYAYRMERYIAREHFTGTGNLAMRRGIFDAVGPFAGIGVAEDRDWGQRAWALGHAIAYLPGMRVYHPARTAFSDLRDKWDRQTAHDYMRNRTRRFARARWLARSAAVAVSPLAEIPRILATDRVAGIRDRWLALAGLTRIRLSRARVMLSLASGAAPERLSGAWNRPG